MMTFAERIYLSGQIEVHMSSKMDVLIISLQAVACRVLVERPILDILPRR